MSFTSMAMKRSQRMIFGSPYPTPMRTILCNHVSQSRQFFSKAPTAPLIPPPHKDDHGKLSVVLDMDETLIHAEFEDNDYRQAEERRTVKNKAAHFTVTLPADMSGPAQTVKIFKRPKLDHLLAYLHNNGFEPILFTAALPVYANPVLDVIDQDKVLRHRLFRDSTVKTRGYPYVKDISMLNRDMKRLVIIDNNPAAMLATVDNAIPIKDFYDDENDNEFEHLIRLLDHLATLEDVRPFLKKQLGFGKHVGFETDLDISDQEPGQPIHDEEPGPGNAKL